MTRQSLNEQRRNQEFVDLIFGGPLPEVDGDADHSFKQDDEGHTEVAAAEADWTKDAQ